MSRLTGDFRTAIRGPAWEIQKLKKLPRLWFSGLPPQRQTPEVLRLRNLLADGMKDAADICGRWFGTGYTSQFDRTACPLDYLDFLEYIARSLPALELAVVVRVMEEGRPDHYSSYYSRPGEATLHPDGLKNVRWSGPADREPENPDWGFPPEAAEWVRFQ